MSANRASHHNHPIEGATVNLYRDRYNDPKTNAQDNLSGRTHYADDDTLRFFHARILQTEVFADGLLFGLVESCSADFHNTKRIFRGVLFDVFGETVYRPDLEESFTTSKAARKALLVAVAAFDVKAHTLQATEYRRKAYARECDEIAALVQ